MKLSVPILILVALCSITTYGQIYHPLIRSNTYWDVLQGTGQDICNTNSGAQYFFEGDTIIMGLEYAIVRSYPIVSLLPVPFCPPYAIDSTNSNVAAFMREDTLARRVYIFDQSEQLDVILYDFSLMAGDTLDPVIGQGLTLVIDSIGNTTLLDGSERKIFYLDNGFFYIESIGGSAGLIFPLFMGLGWWYTPLCVRENDVQLWGEQCYGYLGSVDLVEMPNPELPSITPNPARGTIRVSGAGDLPTDLIFFDLSGREVLRQQIRTTAELVDISCLRPGSYFYRITAQMITGQIVIE